MAIRRVGLDIGGTGVRIAEVEFASKSAGATGTGVLTAFAHVPLPRGAVQNGEVVDVSVVSDAIRRAHAAAQPGSKEVIIGVGSENVIVREIEIPELPFAQLRTSLPFQVQELLPTSTSESLLDFYPTGHRETENASLLRGIMVAAPKTTVSQNILAVEGAGLRPVGVDLSGFALLRAQMTQDLGGKIVALVDIGARITTVVISQNGLPRLVRSLSSGGQDATDAVASILHVELQEAEDLKRASGLAAPANREHQPAQDALMQTTKSLIESVRNTFVYYSSNNPGEAIEHVIITGGGAHLAGLGQYLASSSRLPVSYGNSFARVSPGKKVSAESLKGLDAQVPVAIGLAFGEAA